MRAAAVHLRGTLINRLIYIIGAIVVIVAVLSFFGLR
jgi:ABC-type dipeptide/oligopeptide/nickel transport system permease subunit